MKWTILLMVSLLVLLVACGQPKLPEIPTPEPEPVPDPEPVPVPVPPVVNVSNSTFQPNSTDTIIIMNNETISVNETMLINNSNMTSNMTG